MEVKGKPLDVILKGVKLHDERAGKIDIMLRGVKVLGDLYDRLSRRPGRFRRVRERRLVSRCPIARTFMAQAGGKRGSAPSRDDR